MSERLHKAIPWLIIAALFAVMFCHLASGPYAVVNGPSTAFQSVKNASVVHLAIAAVVLITAACIVIGAFTGPGPDESSFTPHRSSPNPSAEQLCTFLR